MIVLEILIQYLFFHLVKGEFVGRKNRSEGLFGCDASHAADVIDTSGKRGRGEMLTLPVGAVPARPVRLQGMMDVDR